SGCLRFAGVVTHPPRKTRCRLLVQLYRTGLVTRRVPSERFQASAILLSRASWRDVSSSLLLPLHQVGKLDSWEDFQDRQAMRLFTTGGQFGVSSSLLLPLH